MPSLTSHMAARLPIELWPYIVQHASRAADPPPRWGENTTTVARPRDTDIPLTVSKAWLDACMIAGVGRYWRVTLVRALHLRRRESCD